jgi:hypothetical protein
MSKASSTTTWPIDGFDFSPGLATKIGLNEAIVLATIYHQLKKSTKEQAGHYWVFYTLPDWHEYFFPFWSLTTVDRAFKSLRESGLLIATSEYNKRPGDRTLWYRLDYDKLGVLTQDITPARAPNKKPKVRLNKAKTGLTADFSPKSASTAPTASEVVVDTQPAPPPPTPTITSSTVTPKLELEALPGYRGQERLYLVPDALENGLLYWSSHGKRLARCTQEQYLLALGQSPNGTERRPSPLSPPNLTARLGEHSVVLHVPQKPQAAPSVQRLIAKHFGYVGQPGEWKPAPGGHASLRQTKVLASAST